MFEPEDIRSIVKPGRLPMNHGISMPKGTLLDRAMAPYISDVEPPQQTKPNAYTNRQSPEVQRSQLYWEEKL